MLTLALTGLLWMLKSSWGFLKSLLVGFVLANLLVGGLVVSTIFTLFLVPTLFRVTLAARAGLAKLLKISAA